MKTKITEMFGIEHPIIQGGMHFVGNTEGDPERLLARRGLRAESRPDNFGRPLRTTHSTPR